MGRALGVLLVLLVLPALAPAASGSAPEARVLVTFDDVVPVEGAVLGGARVLDAFPFARVALVAGPSAALDALSFLPGVSGVYPEEALTPALSQVRAAVRAEPSAGEAWPGGAGITVALVDSGVDFSHPGFEGRVAADVRIARSGAIEPGRGDPDGHGTHVAGIVAGSGAGSAGGELHGLAPAARLAGVDISEAFTTTSAVRAFEWIHENRAEHGIRVVTNSWGREKDDARYDPDDPVVRASDALVADGLVVVFSAGNRGRDGRATLTSEAMNPNVIAVGASTLGGKPESYSSKGPAIGPRGEALSWTKPDLVAPGTAVVSTRSRALADGGAGESRYYVMMNGTSMAAPQVAAAAALILDARPELTPDIVAEILRATARDAGPSGPDGETGFGLLDVRAALDAARGVGEREKRIVIERRVPLRAEGSVASASDLVLAVGGAPRLPPGERVEVPLTLPAGAARADLWFNWSGPGEFDVRLEGPEGISAFTPAGSGAMRLQREVQGGAHVLVIRPISLASSTPYALAGGVLVREERVVEAPAEFHSRSALQPPVGAFAVAGGSVASVLMANAERIVAFCVALSVCVAGVGLRRSRR